jgi:hypothetical protein
MQYGTLNFIAYDRNLKRVLWIEFLEAQARAARASRFKASIVANPYDEACDAAPLYRLPMLG